MIKTVIFVLLCGASTLFSAIPLGCSAGLPIGDFELRVRSNPKLPSLPLRGINRLEEGQTILYTPGKLRLNPKGGEVTIVLAPAPARNGAVIAELPKLQVLEPKPANRPAEWDVPFRVGIVVLVYGPQGVSTKKVKNFFAKDDDLIAQLADYAEKTAQTEALMAAISAWTPRNSNDVDAALNGFASQYGISNAIDRTLPRDQQTLALIRSVNPTLATVDPVAQDLTQRTAQSAALATSVAGIFFGTPVGLAASGGALFMNLRGMMFPNTEFRSSFALVGEQPGAKLDLCGKRDPARPRFKVAYLWAARVPNVNAPAVKLETASSLPIGIKAPLSVAMDDASWKVIDRAREWKLVDGAFSFPVKVRSAADHKALEVDLAGTKAPSGRYRLEAAWDWDRWSPPGEVHLAPLDDFTKARLVAEDQDKLIEHQGKIIVHAGNADFQFVEKVSIAKKDDRYGKPFDVPFSLPKGRQQGTQDRLELQVDTAGLGAGDYELQLVQQDAKTYKIAMKILPPGPKIANLPLLVNAGESEQSIELRGENLDRLAKLEAHGAALKLGPLEGGGRRLFVELKPDAQAGDKFDLMEYAQDVSQPAVAQGGVRVVGARPRILGAQIALPPKNQVALFKNELPAGVYVSASLQVNNAGAGILVHLTCDLPGSQAVSLKAGEQLASGSVQVTSPDTLFLTFDPGAWPAGCTVSAVLENKGEGRSKPYVLGRVVRVPQVDAFELTEEKAGDNYRGKLTGKDLETIAKVGWNADAGIAVVEMPAPMGGDMRKQSLEIALPWPPPSPRAALWIWFRGDSEGRESKIRYGQ